VGSGVRPLFPMPAGRGRLGRVDEAWSWTWTPVGHDEGAVQRASGGAARLVEALDADSNNPPEAAFIRRRSAGSSFRGG
jgi:hypothetical protein